MKTKKWMKENCSKKTSEIVGIERNYFQPSLAFQNVNVWLSHAVRECRCAAAVISRQRHFCSVC